MQAHIHNGSFRAAISRPKLKSQSAMEYLMTYGWAILIIAVVLGALYSLGVFNGLSLVPKAPPGSCQVFRPYGPRSTTNINLVGTCNGEEPEFVASFTGSPIVIGNLTYNTNSFTVAVWTYTTGGGNMVEDHNITNNYGWELSAGCGGIGTLFFRFDTAVWGNQRESPGCPYVSSSWISVVMTVNGSTVKMYGNGKYVAGRSLVGSLPISSTLMLGEGADGGSNYYGYLSNVQLYNTSFDANQVAALYQDGIGGAPITIQNLVGWWPLNGNANDYSGNNNNGQATNVIYTSSWTNRYSAP